MLSTCGLTYSERAEQCLHPVSKRLFNLMENKQTNLCVAADVTKKADLLALVDAIGSEICVLKTHIDIVEDFDWNLIEHLQGLSERDNFLIFEDRKFADIGNTVKSQYAKGIYRIADWSHITNAHAVPGPGIIEGLKDVGKAKGRGLLLLAEMSSKGTLACGEYTDRTVEMAEEHSDFVMGFISRHNLSRDPRMIHMTPGVQLGNKGDALGQQYLTPHKVIVEYGNDVIIVGRGVYGAVDPAEAAKCYREEGWKAYLERGLSRG
ncbi:Orotidine 5'-phosphate decarboxylase [Chlamydiales bacterium SCGC AG-110-M15]|nr:Orotidine 5'-phosphate decarboxylase [Chlamydiales bacterium SCGC AG-110-M15]